VAGAAIEGAAPLVINPASSFWNHSRDAKETAFNMSDFFTVSKNRLNRYLHPMSP
jgi:hypothetical protein